MELTQVRLGGHKLISHYVRGDLGNKLSTQKPYSQMFSIYFPEIKDIYKNPDAVSGIVVLKVAPLPQDIVKLGVEGINQIWRDAKLRAVEPKRAKTLLSAVEHSIGSQEAPDSVRIELKNLLNDYEIYQKRQDDVMGKIEEKLSEIPYIDKLLNIKGSRIENGERIYCRGG